MALIIWMREAELTTRSPKRGCRSLIRSRTKPTNMSALKQAPMSEPTRYREPSPSYPKAWSESRKARSILELDAARRASRLLKKSPTVIPGRNEGANPESSHTDFLRISGFRIAACAASGMTTEIFQQPAGWVRDQFPGVRPTDGRPWLASAGGRCRQVEHGPPTDSHNSQAWKSAGTTRRAPL